MAVSFNTIKFSGIIDHPIHFPVSVLKIILIAKDIVNAQANISFNIQIIPSAKIDYLKNQFIIQSIQSGLLTFSITISSGKFLLPQSSKYFLAKGNKNNLT